MMKKLIFCLKKIIFNLFWIAVSVMIFVLFLRMTKGFFMIAVGISFLCLACPLMIHDGAKTILDEKNKVNIQMLRDVPICFKKKKVLLSYVKIFILLGLLPAGCFLLPKGLWILVFPPLAVLYFTVLKLTEHTWLAFGWKKWKYWLVNGLSAGILFLSAWICRYAMM